MLITKSNGQHIPELGEFITRACTHTNTHTHTHRVGSRFTTGLRSRIFGCKSNRLKMSTI